jgi:hypothetical protein
MILRQRSLWTWWHPCGDLPLKAWPNIVRHALATSSGDLAVKVWPSNLWLVTNTALFEGHDFPVNEGDERSLLVLVCNFLHGGQELRVCLNFVQVVFVQVPQEHLDSCRVVVAQLHDGGVVL